jgi:hypothetical protein
VTAQQNAMLLLADEMYPGWSATIDGRPETIYRADYLFRAVFVPAGQHTVEFVYQPRSFRLGMLITLLATAGAVGTLWWLAFGSSLSWPFRLLRRSDPVTIKSPGLTPPDAAVVNAGRGTSTRKGPIGDGGQEPKEHAEEEPAKAVGQRRQEEVAR